MSKEYKQDNNNSKYNNDGCDRYDNLNTDDEKKNDDNDDDYIYVRKELSSSTSQLLESIKSTSQSSTATLQSTSQSPSVTLESTSQSSTTTLESPMLEIISQSITPPTESFPSNSTHEEYETKKLLSYNPISVKLALYGDLYNLPSSAIQDGILGGNSNQGVSNVECCTYWDRYPIRFYSGTKNEMFGDPAYGIVKSLLVVYTCLDKNIIRDSEDPRDEKHIDLRDIKDDDYKDTKTSENKIKNNIQLYWRLLDENEAGVIECREENKIPQNKLTVLLASYGHAGSTTGEDVTSSVQAIINYSPEESILIFPAGKSKNNLVTWDPAPMVEKELLLYVSNGCNVFAYWFGEYEAVNLTVHNLGHVFDNKKNFSLLY